MTNWLKLQIWRECPIWRDYPILRVIFFTNKFIYCVRCLSVLVSNVLFWPYLFFICYDWCMLFLFYFPQTKLKKHKKNLMGQKFPKKVRRHQPCVGFVLAEMPIWTSQNWSLSSGSWCWCVWTWAVSVPLPALFLSYLCPDAGNVRNRRSAFESTAGPCRVAA